MTAERKRKLYADRKAAGRCPLCGGPPERPKLTCSICSEKNRTRIQNWRDRKRAAEGRKKWQRKKTVSPWLML